MKLLLLTMNEAQQFIAAKAQLAGESPQARREAERLASSGNLAAITLIL